MKAVTIAIAVMSAIAVAGGIYALAHKRTSTGFLKAAAVPTPIADAFTHWRQRYGKTYGSKAEESHRLNIFAVNFNKVHNHNNSYKHSYTLGLNKFADMTSAEFKQTYLSTKKSTKTTKHITKDFPKTDLTSIDWRQRGGVTHVKDQGQCGSCWAFSTTGGLEGLNAVTNGSLQSYSEQQLVDCAGGEYGNQGCNGGLMDDAFRYTADHGIDFESDYGYTAEDGYCMAGSNTPAFRNRSYSDVESSNQGLLNALANQPVSVGINGDGIQLYFGGIFDEWDGCDPESIDHGVLAVAFGESQGQKTYTIKNSWGADWGEDGYIRFARRDYGTGMCGVTTQAVVPTA